MTQLTYSVAHSQGFPGTLDSNDKIVRTARNNTAPEIAAGRFVAFDTGASNELAVKLPVALTDKLLGVVMLDQAHAPQTTGYAQNELMSVLRQGNILMFTEQAVTPNDSVFVRTSMTAATGSTPALGQVRKSADGVAEVNTVTPTAGNATAYGLSYNINGRTFVFTVLSDPTGTATEICDAFRTVMVADAAFTALVVASGTATLILTSQQAGVPQNITVNASTTGLGGLAIVATTPSAPTAVAAPGCSFLTSASAGGLVWVAVNLPA